VRGFSAAALQALRAYSWPGNVRELRNAVERAVALCRGPDVLPEDLPDIVAGRPKTAEPRGLVSTTA
jgi:DNA-binding NtrC family response regulator